MSRLIKVKLELPDGDHLLATECVADGSGQWARKLISMSDISRTCTIDRSYERGGFSLVIDDTDEAYKTIMESDTNRLIYGSVVTVYCYQQNGATLAETITATISSWRRDENAFVVDCVQEFAGKMKTLPSVTELRITLTDWPDAQVKSVGQIVPMPSGVVYKDHGGQWAYRVLHPSTSNVPFVASWSDPGGDSRIITVDNVYIDGVELDSSKWSFARDVNGWEIITITSLKVPVPWRISCNVTARTPLSATGNPVPHLRDILDDAGVTLIDDGTGATSDADFETYCTANSWVIYGLTPESIVTIKEYLELWCHNFDCFWRIDAAGAVHIKHIDWSSITADASLTQEHFVDLREFSSMDDFANRIIAKFNYDPSESVWSDNYTEDSVDGDYLPATMPVELQDEYVFFSYTAGASTPLTGKIKFVDHPIQIITATMDLYTYEQKGIELLDVVEIEHYNQIGASGKYLVMSEQINYMTSTVEITARRLWGA